ncbi:MAG: 4Fe-4S binding protein [Paramuribaculum sp.]|nr:4Fe-4S binding protein [Paramuribaculum sp.]
MGQSFLGKISGRVVSLAVVFLLMAAASVALTGKLMGHDFKAHDSSLKAETIADDGTVVINTSVLPQRVQGYAGDVPVQITISGDTVRSVEALDNVETPGFFRRVERAGLIDSWTGKSVADAAALSVDAVTGATYSSNALIANVREGLSYYGQIDVSQISVGESAEHGVAFYLSLVVVLMAAIIPLFTRNKRYRTLQLLLNAAILGFWTGTFVDYTMMVGYMSRGLTLSAAIVPAILLVVAFIYPLFGRQGHYCAWVCPLGSLQELAAQVNPRRKIQIGPRTVRFLTTLRMLLWGVLMLCLWLGVWVSWIDYELFAAFIVRSASVAILAVGGAVILLSLFVNRPYCRFVCPTGTLMRMSQNLDNK